MKGPPPPPPAHASLGAALAAAAAGESGVTFVDLRERETHVPFAEVQARARRAAASLRGLGLRRGDRVAIVLPTGPAFLDAFFGTLLAGAVPVPLYPPYRLGRLDEYHRETAGMVAAVGARLLLTDARIRTVLGRTVERANPALGCRDVAGLREGEHAGPEPPAHPDDLALIQFSSGTTRDPKPVALTHRGVMAHLAVLRALLPPEEGLAHTGVSWLPLYHDMGLVGCLLLAVSYPGPLVLIPPEHFLARPALWPRAVSRHRATLSAAPSFGYAICAARVRDEELRDVSLASWRLAICGAEPVSLDALEGFARRFAACGFARSALRPAYGLAETTLAVSVAPGGRAPRGVSLDPAVLAATGRVVAGARRIASVGLPVAGCEVRIRDGEGRAAAERTLGAVFTRGTGLMAGYFGRPEATAAAIADGWLDTGDLGFLADGELYVCGRRKDVIVIRGANHAPEVFEECLAGIPGLRAGCAVAVGSPAGDGGEEGLLILAEILRAAVPGGGEPALAERVARQVLGRTGIRPHAVVLLEPDTLPRTASGKLRRGEALRRWQAGKLAPPRGTAAALASEVPRSGLGFVRARLARRGRRTRGA